MPEYFKKTIDLIRNNLVFYILYLVCLILSMFFQIKFGKEATFNFINKTASLPFDYFFKYATQLGFGGLFVILVLYIFYKTKNKNILYQGLLSFASSSIITQGLKKIVFKGTLRPSLFLGEANIRKVLDVQQFGHNSFPSGHTTSAFAMCLFFATLTKNNSYKLLFGLLAAIIGYSRIYLGQHFLEDVILGSIIGVLFTTFVIPFFTPNELQN